MSVSRSPASRRSSRPGSGTGHALRRHSRARLGVVRADGTAPIRRGGGTGGGSGGGSGGGTGGGGGPKGTRPPRPGREALAAVRVRRSITLLVLTLVAPGSAQLVTGRSANSSRPPALSRARLVVARAALRTWCAFAVLAVLLVLLSFVNREWVLGMLTRQWVLRPLAAVFFAGAVIWPVLLVDAWRSGQAPELTRRSRRWIALLTAVLMLTTFAVPLALGRRVWAGADLLSGVFGSGKDSAAVDGRYNVLLLGGDSGEGRIGTRPDSIHLASVDEKTGETALFSLPRNLQNVPFPSGTPAAKALPQGYDCGDNCLLNAIYQYGTDNPSLFPGAGDPGAEAMMQAAEGVTGLKVNYYVTINLKGFEQLIDEVGGVEINVLQRTAIGGGSTPVRGYIEAGRRRLDGHHALWYARSRVETDDYDRMARQRCVMTAMVNQLDPSKVLTNFQGIASAGSQVVATDVPAGRLPTFLSLAQKAKRSEIESVQFVPPVIVPAHPDFAEIRRQVKATIAQLEGEKVEAEPAAAATPPSATVSPAPAPSAATAPGPTEPLAQATNSAPVPSSRSAAVDVRSVC